MNDVKELLDKYNFKIERLSFNDNIRIVNTSEGKFVIKSKKNNDTRELFRYLKSKNFHNYLDYINDDQDNFMIFPYISDDIKVDKEEIAKDIILLISLLHSRTSFYKSFPIDEVKAFYEGKIEYISELEKYYENIRLMIEEQYFMAPSYYFLLRNISWIFHSLNSSKYFLDKWYEISKNKKNRRLCLIHGNLELDHIIGSEERFLISWDHARVDVPIYDLLGFYKKNFNEVSFYTLLNIYEEKSPLLPEERYLLFALMFIPEKIKFDKEEILNTKDAYYLIKYLTVTSQIISNYHPSNSNKKHD